MDNGNVTFNAQKAEVVKFVFDELLKGSAYNGILRALNDKYRGLAIGKQWYTTNVYHILDNIIYSGYSKDKDGNIDKAINIPQAVISYTQWTEAQRIMAERKGKVGKYNTRDGEGKHFLPYSGVLQCECGRRLQMLIDNGVVYQCKNGGEHTTRIRVDDNFINSLQSLFMISVIDAEKELHNLRTASNQSDDLRAKITVAEQALKAKMRLIESDEDYEIFKEEIQAKKAEIKELKAKLLESEARQGEDLDTLTEAIKQDFEAIASGETLEKTTYQRLLAKTIEKITVYAERITVSLKDGNSVDLPRIVVDGRGRKVLPDSKMQMLVKQNGLHKVFVTFGDGEEFAEIKGEGYVIRVAK
jgi:hypothetical protein